MGSYLIGTVGDPERWKWTFCHFPSRRCQTRVSSDCIVFGIPLPSMYCVSRMYAMQAASSPTRCTWGLRMMVWIGLLLLDKARTQTHTHTEEKLRCLCVSRNNSCHPVWQDTTLMLSRHEVTVIIYWWPRLTASSSTLQKRARAEHKVCLPLSYEETSRKFSGTYCLTQVHMGIK